jgi:hypothetical protein
MYQIGFTSPLSIPRIEVAVMIHSIKYERANLLR